MKPKLKLIKQYRAPLVYKALIIYRKDKITAKRQRAYSTRENAILGAMKWIMRDGQSGSKVMIYHAITSQEVAVIKMSSLGNIKTTYPWGDIKK